MVIKWDVTIPELTGETTRKGRNLKVSTSKQTSSKAEAQEDVFRSP